MDDPRCKVAVIGFGAMGRSLASSLAQGQSGVVVRAALVRDGHVDVGNAGLAILRSVADLLRWGPSLVVECAGHAAVRETVPALLEAGVEVVAASIGALCDPAVRTRLEDASSSGGGRLSLVSGAVGGLDVLRAAALAGLDTVAYRGTKHPRAWLGTPAEAAFDLAALFEPIVIFRGTAAEAAALYPKNANVTAAVALAGIGFERTGVVLTADPNASGNAHGIEATGAFGSLSLSLKNRPLPDNFKTSWLAALSVEQAVLRHFQTIDY